MSDSLWPHRLAALQAPLSMEFSGQEHRSALLFCAIQVIFPTPGSNLGLLPYRQILYQLSHQGSPDIFKIPSKSKDIQSKLLLKFKETNTYLQIFWNPSGFIPIEFLEGKKKSISGKVSDYKKYTETLAPLVTLKSLCCPLCLKNPYHSTLGHVPACLPPLHTPSSFFPAINA